MAVALATVKIALIVAMVTALTGSSTVQPARAQTEPIFTLSVDRYLLNICGEVTFTVVMQNLSAASARLSIKEIDDSGDSNDVAIKNSASDNVSHTLGYISCKPGRFVYQARWRTQRSNGVVLQWLHPAEGGTERLRMVSDGGVYTNIAPVITSLDYDALEAVTNVGVVSYNVNVLVKWSAVQRATGYEIVANSSTQEVIREATDSEAASTQAEITFTDIYPNDEQDMQATFQVRALLNNGESSPVILDTGTGPVAVAGGAKVYSPLSEMASTVVRREGSNPPIDTTSAGEPSIVAPGAAPEGITAVARLIAEQTGMGAGAATTLLPLLCLLLAGGAAAVVVVPLGFSPLSLAAGFLVFTLVWSVGGVAWFGLPIAVAALPPVLLAASGVMIVRRRGMFG